jgi:two-component system CheB/CheR fusion protein
MAEKQGEQVQKTRTHDFQVVGIGASAGGLEALEVFFKALPANTGMAFVVIQHLSPDFKSHMEELLGRHTSMPIHRVENGMQVNPNSVYLIPAKMEMVISEGKLLLTEKSRERTLSHPIDQFFRSLANDVGSNSVGVILSGTGSDGSRGIRDIHEAGGLVIAQDETSAKFDGMPMNAQSTGVVNVVLPPVGIAEALVKYAEEGLSREALAEQDLLAQNIGGIDKIFYLLQQLHGLDFSHYKSTTVGRRIQRRADLLRLDSLEKYIQYIETQPEEVDRLYKDLLIGVTKFFRDPAAFEILESQVIPKLFERQSDYPTIRIWVAGCASGEEAYSIAMLVDEEMRRRQSRMEVKIFATDAHHESLQTAAKGVFPEDALSELTKERRDCFFREKRDGYHVTRELRRYIVFAPHNLIRDAPFTQMDMVTCRNLLIYLQPPAQKKVLSMFHFALKSGGTLFLGPSESPADLSDEFQVIDKRWRLYSKRRDVRLPLESRLPFGTRADGLMRGPVVPAVAAKPRIDTSLMGIYDRLLERKMPASFLLNDNFEILHVFSGAERYAKMRIGRPTNNLLDVIIDPLRTALSGAVQHANRKQDVVRYAGLRIPTNEGYESVRMIVEPIYEPNSKSRCLLVEIEAVEDKPETMDPDLTFDLGQMSEDRVASLESELRYSQENLQATVEEMETSNEELQASNEELVASNEELQSTNEELHSVNEELYTVNAEHQRRVEELARSNDDMDNLLATTRVGVIFLDEDLYIRRFTPEIARQFHLVQQDIGRSIEGFSHSLQHDSLIEDLRRVIATQTEVETNVEDHKGNRFLLRILPYRTDGKSDGVVMTLVDVSSLKSAQADLERFKFMTETASDSIALIDHEGRFVYVNPVTCELLGYTTQQLLDANFVEIDQTMGPNRLQELFESAASGKVQPFRAKWQRRDGTSVMVEVSVSDFEFEGEHYLSANTRDITERVAAEQELKIQHLAMESAENGILISDATTKDLEIIYLNPGFTSLTGYEPNEVLGYNCRFLQGEETDPEAVRVMRKAIKQGQPCHVTILNYRKDGSKFWNDLQITPVHDRDGRLINFVGIQNDVTERVEAETLAKRNAERVQTILDATAEGIFGLDNSGLCTFCNQSAVVMLGYENDTDLVGKNMHQLIHHSKSDGSACHEADCPIFKVTADRGSSPVTDEVYWRRDGTSFPVEYSSRPLVRDGVVQGSVISFQDITQRIALQKEQKQTLRQLEDANRAAQKASQTKSEFLANMSHEIRTPMSAIMGYSDILARHLSDPDNVSCVNIIRENGRFLLDIIEDILDISKIEAGKIELLNQEFRLDRLLAELRTMMELRAREKQLKFTVEIVGRVPQSITSDSKRLKQILINLAGNAIKFTDSGLVKIVLQYCKQENRGRLQFDVVDTGIGLHPDQLEKLFRPFTQADAAVDRKYGGTGLGLAISQRLARMLGGEITVDSAPGKGSRFMLALDIEAPRSSALVGNEAFEEAIAVSPPVGNALPKLAGRILVVDDRREVRFIAQSFIEDAGGRVSLAADGQQCIEMTAMADEMGEPFDLVVMDIQMPICDGYEATRALRQAGFDRPIIALTAHAMEGDREKCLQAGCDDYISKPLDKADFLETISKYLSGQTSRLNENDTKKKLEDQRAPHFQTKVEPKTILIIDDGEHAANALASLLELEGHEVAVALDAAQGISKATEMQPSIVLLDLGLPDMSGFEALQVLRDQQSLQDTKFIAVTGEQDVSLTSKAGFDSHLLKPVDLKQLSEILENRTDSSADVKAKL